MEQKANRFGFQIVNESSNQIPERLGISEDRIAILTYKMQKYAVKYLNTDDYGITSVMMDLAAACDDANELVFINYIFALALGKMSAMEELKGEDGLVAIMCKRAKGKEEKIPAGLKDLMERVTKIVKDTNADSNLN